MALEGHSNLTKSKLHTSRIPNRDVEKSHIPTHALIPGMRVSRYTLAARKTFSTHAPSHASFRTGSAEGTATKRSSATPAAAAVAAQTSRAPDQPAEEEATAATSWSKSTTDPYAIISLHVRGAKAGVVGLGGWRVGGA